MTSKNLQVWLEGAIFAAMAIVLSLLPTNIGSSFTISLGMIPLSVYAIRHGVKAGLFAGFLWGVLHFLTGDVWILSVTQALIEYFVAFTFAGFAGVTSKKVVEAVKADNQKSLALNLSIAALAGCLARFFWHFLAGAIFWGAYALWGMNPFVFSLVMNGASGLATAVATGIALVIIGSKFPQVFVAQKNQSSVVKEESLN